MNTKEYNREYYLKNQTKIRRRQQQHRLQYKGIRKRTKDKPITRRKYTLRTKYGITLEDYDKLLTQQTGSCALCSCTPKKYLCIDHDHQTGKVRGLLCSQCNTALGKLGDTAESIKKVLAYLEKSSCP